MLPGVDDGPVDTKEALEMIDASYIDGIRHIVMTSHLNHPLGFSGEDDYDGIFCDFKKLVKERYPDLKIYTGSEVYISRKILSEMDKLDIRTINNSKYVLVEFSRNVKFHEMDMAVHELKLMGYKTIIAHIEQYHAVREKYEDIRQLKADGAVIQCNNDSFNKKSRYSNVVGELMKRNLVDFVASDCHNMDDRAPGLKKTYKSVRSKYGREFADRIFLENPERLIKGDDLVVLPNTKGKAVIGRTSKLKFAAVAAVGICVAVLFISKGISPTVDIEVAAVEDSTVTDVEHYDNVDNIVIATDNIDNTESFGEDVSSTEGEDVNLPADGTTDTGVNEENNIEIVEESHEELLVKSYVSFLENLESEYMDTCEGYYSMLKSAIDLEDETERDVRVEGILDELGSVENSSDNQVYKTLYDMQNDLEEYKYDVAVVKELREHYIEVKMEVSEEYKIQLEEYGNRNNV
jgi:protein-tyrosine phosphatase